MKRTGGAGTASGPSEFGTSVTVAVTPDVITQDWRVPECDHGDGERSERRTAAYVSLRAEIQVGGIAADFGRLSAQSLVTDSNGRATTVYTAPASIPGQMLYEEASRNVTISVTPVGTDFLN